MMEWILISTPRGLEKAAYRETRSLIKKAGFDLKEIQLRRIRLKIIGLILVELTVSSIEVIDALFQLGCEDPWQFRYILKMRPLQELVDSKLDAIIDMIQPLIEKILVGDSFRITLTRRLSNIDRKSLLYNLAELIDRPVDLEHPNWIVLIEILAGKTGISIIRPRNILALADIRSGKAFIDSSES